MSDGARLRYRHAQVAIETRGFKGRCAHENTSPG